MRYRRILTIGTTARMMFCVGALSLVASSCATTGESSGEPMIVVTSNVLADVVSQMVGDQGDVVSLMGPGASPHDVQLSAKQAAQLREAELIIAVGGGLEAGLSDTLDSARNDGADLYEAIDSVKDLHPAGHDHGDADHDGSEVVDPHFFTDPVRMAQAIEGIQAELSRIEGIDTTQLETQSARYLKELDQTHQAMATELDRVAPARRFLVTNHEVFGYFAERFDFDVLGVVIESLSVSDGVDAKVIAKLASVLDEHDVPAVFADASSNTDLAETVAAEADSPVTVEVLYSESLSPEDGPAPTYLEMLMVNARTIASALE